jgi:hypothetical protein
VKVYLLHRDRDLVLKPELQDAVYRAMVESSSNPFAIENTRRNLERERARRPQAEQRAPATTPDELLTQDLELETVWQAMAAGDDYLYETARRVLLSPLAEPDEIRYRQRVLADCLDRREVVRRLYELAQEGVTAERQAGSLWSGATPSMILRRSVDVLTLHLDVLRRLRHLAEEEREGFRSEGFRRLFSMLEQELDDEYLAAVEQHLGELEFRHGLLQTARLGKGFKGRDYVVRREREPSWAERVLLGRRSSGYSFQIHPRDEAGARALEDLRARGLNEVASAVAESAEHVRSFFTMLKLELAFYLGCLNLHERLAAKGEPTCFPEPLAADAVSLVARGIYDVSLTLHLEQPTVGNDVDADGKALVVITGANQGGKSTLLRALGLAQLMLQAGMFVGASSFRASVCTGLFTHYKREEDETMAGGKLEEELRRMRELARGLRPHCLLLCNESFASTNEREGSEIAGQIVRALLERRLKVFYVTHLYELARGLYEERRDDGLFLRAERGSDGERPYRLREGAPLPTSFGEDSYRRVFADAPDPEAEAAPEPEPQRAAGRP